MDGALNNLRTLARQFIQFSVALVCARDVGRVLVSGESEGMAVEDDVNVFRKTLDDLIDLGKRGSAFKERSRQSRTREYSLKRPADPEILFNDRGRTQPRAGGRLAKDRSTLRSRQLGESIHQRTRLMLSRDRVYC